MTIILYPLLCVAVYYLASRALITKWLWSRYPSFIDKMMLCASCTGWWLGLGCAGIGYWLGLPFLGLASDHWFTFVAVGLSAIVWTPLIIYPLLTVLEALTPQESDEVPDAP